MEKEHGFTECSEWEAYFRKYIDSILSIEKLTAFSSAKSVNGQEWLALYKKRSMRLRAMYLNNEKYLERHLYWFIKNPENWEDDVAKPLLDYLFRNSTRIEDIEAAQKSAESLYRYYQKTGNEIAMMKCTFIFLTNWIMLDFPHNKGKILKYTKWAIDIYERYYSQLDEIERSMGLSFYDYESNACSECVNFEPILTADMLIKLYQRRMERIDKFMEEEDMSLPINQIVPYLRLCWQNSFISIPIKSSHMKLSSAQLNYFLNECEQLSREKKANSSAVRHVKIQIMKLMLEYRAFKINRDQAMEQLLIFQEQLPKPTLNYDDELIDALQILSSAIRLTAADDKKYRYAVNGILQIMLKATLCLPGNNYIEHVIDNTIFLYMIPMLKILPYDEILKTTLFLTIFRQPQTAAHTIMVSKLAALIVAAMIERQPEGFMSVCHFSSPQMVQENAHVIIDYIGEASLLHDVGKLLSSNVINMQYRKLIDSELEAIRLHPITGGEILKQIPAIANYYDIAVGHHKSYDGKSGYPASFDNLSSPQKLFIDLITICDTLDAATDNLGRNYAKTKQFDEVLMEMAAEKGTRYSTAIVELILSDYELQQELKQLLNEREESYIQVFDLISVQLKEFQDSQKTEADRFFLRAVNSLWKNS